MIEYINSPATPEGSAGLLAIVVRHNTNVFGTPRGIRFLTDKMNPLQLALINYNPSDEVKAHRHLPIERKTEVTQEVLFVRSGTITVCLYTEDGTPVDYVTLTKGDVILLMGGAHSLKTYTNSEVVEVKSGPYLSRALDKINVDVK